MNTAQLRRWSVGGRSVRGRPLWVEDNGDLLIGNDDGSIARLDPLCSTLTQEVQSPLPLLRRTLACSRLVARLLRLPPRSFVRLASGTSLWVAGGRLWRCDAGQRQPEACFVFSAGSGPLFLASTPDGSVVFGDYVATHEKLPSAIRRSRDEGRSWAVIHEFSPNRIRHVHGVFWDPYADCLCMTTGDADHEAGLWRMDNDTPVLIAGGRSLFRVVQPVFTADAILFGTDTPGEACGIYRLSRATGKVERLLPTRGPVFFGTHSAGRIAFTTVVEPGHPQDHAALYLGGPEGGFSEALTLSKDSWHMQLFQYGQIHLPANAGHGTRIWYSPCATADDSQLCSLEFTA
jgi:hypothetical protein